MASHGFPLLNLIKGNHAIYTYVLPMVTLSYIDVGGGVGVRLLKFNHVIYPWFVVLHLPQASVIPETAEQATLRHADRYSDTINGINTWRSRSAMVM